MVDTSPDPAQSVPAFQKWLGRIMQAVRLLFLLMIVGALAYWGFHRSRLQAELSRLRSEGMPTNIVELETFYKVSPGMTDSTALWTAAVEAVQQANLSIRGKDLPVIGANELTIPPLGEPWNELDAARDLMQELALAFHKIHAAADAGGQVRFPIQFSGLEPSIFPEVQALRQVARLLCLDAQVAARDGDCHRAIQDLQIILNMPSLLQNEPLLIPQLVRIAFQAMGLHHLQQVLPICSVDDATLQSLQTVIATPDYLAGMIRSLQGERALGLSMSDQIPLGPLIVFGKLSLLRVYQEGLTVMTQSRPVQLAWAEKMKKRDVLQSGIHNPGEVWVSLLRPAIEAMIKSSTRAAARQRCAVIALAAQRYYLRHHQWPASLTAIAPDLIGTMSHSAEWLQDPYDGNPLRYKNEPERILIYSISEDQQDNGGAIDPDDTNTRPPDIGFAIHKSSMSE